MGSLHAAFHSKETTDKLSYSSLVQDEVARKSKEFTLPKTPRFGGARDIRNGNILPLVVESERDPAGPLSPTMRVNTNTRTQFQDAFYESHVSIADRVSSPKFKSSVMKQTGHLGMDCMSATDPRQHTVKPAHNPNVGPGFYEADPMHMHTTGMASYHPADSHHMLAFAKDPARPSPAFLTPTREAKDPRVLEGLDTSAISYLPPDFDSWKQGGGTMGRQPRNIQSERWGANVRELKAPPNDLFYDPQVTSDGRAATCSAYSSDPSSPSYRLAFNSGLPRLIALPGGKAPDTRIVARDHAQLCSTPPSAGPGAYALEPPRYRSFHAAYSNAQNYHSLASEAAQGQGHGHGHWQGQAQGQAQGQGQGQPMQRQRSTSPGPPSPTRGHRNGGGGGGSLSSTGRASRLQSMTLSLPGTPAGTSRGGLGASSRPDTRGSLHAYGQRQVPVEKGAAAAAAAAERLSSAAEAGGLSADDDWLVHQALLRSHFASDGSRLPMQSSGGGGGSGGGFGAWLATSDPASAADLGPAGGREDQGSTPGVDAAASVSRSASGAAAAAGAAGAGGDTRAAGTGLGDEASVPASGEEDLSPGVRSGLRPALAALVSGEDGGVLERAHSAPPSPGFTHLHRPLGRFDNLAFLRRATPYQKLVKAHLDAAADLKLARKQAHLPQY